MNEKGANQQLLKRSNCRLVKKCIYQRSPISRLMREFIPSDCCICGVRPYRINDIHTDVFARGKQVK